PVVTIVVEGGQDTVNNTYYDLRANIPVIIVDGTGRAADFFTRWLFLTKDLENDVENKDIICEIEELASSAGSQNINQNDQENDKSKQIDELMNRIMYCLQPAIRSRLTVFSLNSGVNLTETIFRSICRSRQTIAKMKLYSSNIKVKTKREDMPDDERHNMDETIDRHDILKKEQKIERKRLLTLAMNWNCIHIAKEFIFQNSLDNIMNKKRFFIDALINNLPTFVYEFLKLGIDPAADVFFSKSEVSKRRSRYAYFIETLYQPHVMNKAKTHLKDFIDSDRFTSDKFINNIEKLNVVLTKLIGDYMRDLYFETEEAEHEDRVKWGLTQNFSETDQYEHKDIENNQLISVISKQQKQYDYIIRDLFLWAILMNYVDMAKVFLCYLKYRICPALIATKILKQYYLVANYGDLKERYMESANYFEQYAIDCLDKCDDYDAAQACEIILQQNELYGYVTCLQVAADANDKLFIATPCCVEAINNIWYDKLHPEQTSLRNRFYLFCAIISLGLLAPPLLEYRVKNKNWNDKGSKAPKLRDHSINYSDSVLLEDHPNYSNPNPEETHAVYFRKLRRFHESLPMKFTYHVISYIFFLLLFSYVLLFKFSPPSDKIPSIDWTEILTIILVSCMLIEEIHYFFTQDSVTNFGKLKSYCRDLFKPLAMIAFVLFYIGLILRFRHAGSKEDFVAARIVMAIDVAIWWLRCLSFIIVIPFLGPHLVAIGKMLQDLVFFLCIIAVVMIGYGVASRSMVYYPVENGFTTKTNGSIDNSFDGRAVFHQVLYPVYYLLYSQFGNELQNLDNNSDAGWSIATHVLLAFHMIFVNLLLANLLIAMFSKRFDEVHEDTQHIWRSQTYLYTREYYARSPFLPPISLFYDIYYLIRMFVFFIRRTCLKHSEDSKAITFKIVPNNKSIVKEWYEFEDSATYEHAYEKVKEWKATLEKSKLEFDSGNKIKKVQNDNNSDNKAKKDKKVPNDNDPDNILNSLKEIQNDLSKLKLKIEATPGDANMTSKNE
ncbi:unnamed protein product, partial [Rotaria sp. Silwood1]